MSASNGTPPYRVSYLPAVREQLRVWGEWANENGERDWYAAVLQEVDRRLHTDPREWGDPQWEYHKAAWSQYRWTGTAFILHYIVHHTEPLVIVQIVKPHPSGPFPKAEG